MLRKLIIFLLFIALTLVAVDFISINQFTIATNIKTINSENINDEAGVIGNAEEGVVIFIPKILQSMTNIACIAIVHTSENVDEEDEDASVPAAGYVCIFSTDLLEEGDLSALSLVFDEVKLSSIIMWLFTLLLIILLPRRRSRRSVRKIAERVAQDEIDNSMPRRRSYDRGRSKRHRYEDDEDDFD